ncbi:MAG TPA: LysR family transcriptional regulator [Solimonas sp.]|nr:LysR family transcriptional regulator [Solimonas sp.]
MSTSRKSPLKLEADLGFTLRSGLAANASRIALLEQIGVTGSITAAAKAVGLSYKAAWDAVATMNNLADRPLVEGSAGGKHGGGTRLTARGIELVQSFRALEAEHRRFLDSLNAAHARVGKDLRVLGRLAM